MLSVHILNLFSWLLWKRRRWHCKEEIWRWSLLAPKGWSVALTPSLSSSNFALLTVVSLTVNSKKGPKHLDNDWGRKSKQIAEGNNRPSEQDNGLTECDIVICWPHSVRFLCGLHQVCYGTIGFLSLSTRVERLSRGPVSHTRTLCRPIFNIVSGVRGLLEWRETRNQFS